MELSPSISYPWPTHIRDMMEWSSIGVLLLSFILVCLASTASSPSSVLVKIPPPPRLAEAKRRRKLWKVAQMQIEVQRGAAHMKAQCAQGPYFPFTKLPLELQFAILALCSGDPQTYRALVLVSQYFHHTTTRACLPCIPITLITTRELLSFVALLRRRVRYGHAVASVGTLVRRLWVTPIREKDAKLGQEILSACPNLRSLACDSKTLAYLISRRCHMHCTELTLLLSRRDWDLALSDTPHGASFLSKLTHLRVTSEQLVPYRSAFLTKLTHLSYFERPQLYFDKSNMLDKPQFVTSYPLAFPSLSEVVLTRRCDGDTPPPKRFDRNFVLLHVPRELTEVEMWKNSVKGESLWSKAAKAISATTNDTR